MAKQSFKIGFYFLCALIFSMTLCGQNNSIESDSIIYWSEDRKLTWDDFEFKNDTTQKAIGKAIATSQLNIKFINSSKNTIIIACFYKKNSYSITRIDEVLQHEQLHFDIAELFARKIRKAISESNLNKHSYHTIYENYKKEWEEYDKLFDNGILGTYAEKTITEEGEEYALIKSESSNIYVIGQKYWRDKIDKELKELEAYKSPFVK